jgi:dihydrodipicolinate synthase/N-acetylneuraminate lyase
MSAGCTIGMESFIMTSLNFIPEAALELLKFREGNRNLKNAQETQQYITSTVNKIKQYGKYI